MTLRTPKAWEEKKETDAPLSIQLLINCSAFVGLNKERVVGFDIQQTINTWRFSPTLPPVLLRYGSVWKTLRSHWPPVHALRTWGQRSASPMAWHHERAQRSRGHEKGGGRHNNDKVTWDGHRIPSHDGNQLSETMRRDGLKFKNLLLGLIYWYYLQPVCFCLINTGDVKTNKCG